MFEYLAVYNMKHVFFKFCQPSYILNNVQNHHLYNDRVMIN